MESASLQVLLLADVSFVYHTNTQMQMLLLADVNLVYYTHAQSDVEPSFYFYLQVYTGLFLALLLA